MADVKLDGLDNLLKELERLGKEGEKIERIALVKAGEKIKDAIVRETPQRSGTLKRGIKISGLKRKDGAAFIEVYPSENPHVASFLEFGTTKMPANPFMSRGYEGSKEEAENIIIEEIKKGLGL